MSGIEYKETLTIHFIKKDGQVQDVRVPIGMTLMDAARVYAEPTIDEVPAIVVVINLVVLVILILKRTLTKLEL